MNPLRSPESAARPPARRRLGQGLLVAVLFAVQFATLSARAQNTSQSFNLQAGWNAIWLEISPVNPDVNVALAGLPLDSIWTFQARLTAADFIQDPSEPVWNRERWLVHVPTNRLESLNNNLFSLTSHRAYLIKLTAAATLNVTGQPALRRVAWVPDAYNLRGFPIDPASPPTFNTFFRPSSAHFNSISNRLERIYKLNAAGQWSLAGPGETMQRGTAYWVFCRGGSDYQAPFEVDLGSGESLTFGASVDQLTIQLVNRSTTAAAVSLRDASAATPLAYGLFNPTNGLQWLTLPSPLTQPLPGGQGASLKLAVRRAALAPAGYASIAEFRNGAGIQYLIPVTASRSADTPVSPGSPASYAGLWVGTATLDAVSDLNSVANTSVPGPTPNEFNLRLILHVDRQGIARLLRHVVQLWQDGTFRTDDQGRQSAVTPGRFVLVTDDRLIPSLRGAALRDGQPVGRRLSSSHFDFAATSAENFLTLAGSFGNSNTLTGAITLPPNFPTNPFRHKYHPDHDNLDATFTSFRAEAYTVSRAFAFEFSPTNTLGATTADYGYRQVTGTYRETLTGLHRAPLQTRGRFRLTRISDLGALNE